MSISLRVKFYIIINISKAGKNCVTVRLGISFKFRLKIFKKEVDVLKEKYPIITAGVLFGIMAVFLVLLGNPANMGFCIACFLRDIAGGLGLHRAAVVRFSGQPVAHNQAIWNFLGMGIVGLAAVLAGGCPLRQLILAGEGNADALATILGTLLGAALMHNFGWAASANGVTSGGKIMVAMVWILLLVIGFAVTRQAMRKIEKKETGISTGLQG